jgi:hypothetical protein
MVCWLSHGHQWLPAGDSMQMMPQSTFIENGTAPGGRGLNERKSRILFHPTGSPVLIASDDRLVGFGLIWETPLIGYKHREAILGKVPIKGEDQVNI